MFHLVCLRGWLEHQHTCPICRRAVHPEPSREAAAAVVGGAADAGAGAPTAAEMRDAARQMLRDLGLPAEDEGELLGMDHADAPLLGDASGPDPPLDLGAGAGAGALAIGGGEPLIRRQSWTFGWGGGGWLGGWLPRLSIEVVRQRIARDPGGHRLFAEAGGAGAGRERALEAAAAQVLSVLPDLSPRAVRQDLLLTGDLQVFCPPRFSFWCAPRCFRSMPLVVDR